MNSEKEKLYQALLDAVNKSQYFGNIPLPAVLDNQLEALKEKYGYNNVPEEAKPKFEDEKEKPLTKAELSKKLRDKLKGLEKKREKAKETRK